nr:flavin reductase family protein [Pseudaestuariivita atlantica]
MTQTFQPSPDTARDLRDALGRFGTGVTVVTCTDDEGPLGITANSFASVSLDPALVLWSPAKASKRYASFAAAKSFAIHIVGADQHHLCHRFARDGRAFDGAEWRTGRDGAPILDGALSVFECTTHAMHDAGDHTIIVGRVDHVTTGSGAPLLFYGGKYGGFTEPD